MHFGGVRVDSTDARGTGRRPGSRAREPGRRERGERARERDRPPRGVGELLDLLPSENPLFFRESYFVGSDAARVTRWPRRSIPGRFPSPPAPRSSCRSRSRRAVARSALSARATARCRSRSTVSLHGLRRGHKAGHTSSPARAEAAPDAGSAFPPAGESVRRHPCREGGRGALDARDRKRRRPRRLRRGADGVRRPPQVGRDRAAPGGEAPAGRRRRGPPAHHEGHDERARRFHVPRQHRRRVFAPRSTTFLFGPISRDLRSNVTVRGADSRSPRGSSE